MVKVFKAAKWARDSYIVSSKAFFGAGGTWPTQKGLSRKHLMEACHQALTRLQLDYLDLYFCHRPDPDIPVGEIVETMTNLVRQGKVFYWGTSMWPAEKIVEAYEFANTHHLVAPVMEQPQYNIFYRNLVEKEYAHVIAKYGMGLTTWSPLAAGLLTGKYNKGVPEGSRLALESYQWLKGRILDTSAQQKLDAVTAIKEVADSVGLPLPRFGIAWCLKNPAVSTVILGASKTVQLKENLLALDDVEKITADVTRAIDEIFSGVKLTSGMG